MVAIEPRPSTDAVSAERSVDLRTRIPKLGLREYWYPAILDREVSAKKPVFRTMLGQDLCLFRGQSGQVVALANACHHRGAMLDRDDCTYRGLVPCLLHEITVSHSG